MPFFTANGFSDSLWFAFGLLGQLIFQGRFYVQWLASEFAKRSVIPTVFWYMSSAGSLMLLVYAFHIQSPVGALGQSLNIVIYSRNLVHIWRRRSGNLDQRYPVLHALVACIVVAALAAVAHIWYREYVLAQAEAPERARQIWFWLAVGVAGQGLFACRFLVQWLVTEYKRRSVVPTAFWYLSIAASILLFVSYVQRREWVFAIGMALGALIYLRNLWFIHRGKPVYSDDDASGG